MIVHQEFVTGPQWDVRLLALILVAEWQHFEYPLESEQQCQQRLMGFRQRLGLEDVAPGFQHGFGEGKGVE